MAERAPAPSHHHIEGLILSLRGQRVILDFGLAPLYCVEVRTLNQAVRRNIVRFPADFMFRLTAEELESLRSQSVILKTRRGGHRKYPPYAFTEQGVAMLSGVLSSKRAVQVNIEIMRTFVRLRQLLSANADLARKLEALEKKDAPRGMAISKTSRAQGVVIVVASPRLFEPECRTPEQIRWANGLCRYREMATVVAA